MNKFRVTSLIFYAVMLSPFAYAATQIDLTTGVKGKLPRANGGTGTTMSASAASAAASATNSAGGLAALDSSAKLPEAQLPSSVLAITCASPADNDTYAASGTGVTCIHHPAPVSSASATVTIDSTYVNTTSPNIANGASNAVWTIPLSASMPVSVGDSIGVQQEGAGTVTISGVSETVTVNGQGDKKTTCGLHGTLLAIYNGYIASHDVWNVVGCRQ